MTANSPVSATPYGTLPPASPLPQRRPVSLPRLARHARRGEKITMLTAYDATFAAVADAAGVECMLVGDSLGMVCQGLPSTVGVTPGTMRYHTESVARGLHRVQGTAWLMADLPFGSYQESREQALRSACVLMQAGAHMVKLEGGGWTADTVRFLVQRGIPVCAHLGLTPQTVHALGGYRVQGKGDDAAAHAAQEAHELQNAGAAMLVLEMVPATLAADSRPNCRTAHTIGIGAGTAPPARCWCCTTCWASTWARCRSSCATSWQDARQRARRHGSLCAGGEGRRFPDDACTPGRPPPHSIRLLPLYLAQPIRLR